MPNSISYLPSRIVLGGNFVCNRIILKRKLELSWAEHVIWLGS